MKDNNYNKDYYNYTQSGSENNYPEKTYTNSNSPLPANSYLPQNNNNLHPVDELNKFNSKTVSQSQMSSSSNKDRPYQAGVYYNNNNNSINNRNSDIPYQAGNMQYQTQNQIPYQQQQIPYQQQPQIPYQQQPQQIPIQQIPIQPQVTYVNPQPVIMAQPNFVTVPNVQYGVCPYCAGSGISFQTGLRCNCVGGPSSGEMFALGMGLGMYGGYRRHYFYP
jgi:hypothetical protein